MPWAEDRNSPGPTPDILWCVLSVSLWMAGKSTPMMLTYELIEKSPQCQDARLYTGAPVIFRVRPRVQMQAPHHISKYLQVIVKLTDWWRKSLLFSYRDKYVFIRTQLKRLWSYGFSCWESADCWRWMKMIIAAQVQEAFWWASDVCMSNRRELHDAFSVNLFFSPMFLQSH